MTRGVKEVAGFMITANTKCTVLAALSLAALAAALATPTPSLRAQEAARTAKAESSEDKRWQAVAPGRVEPASGEIKLAAPVMALIAEVLVKANDKVFAGEPLIRLIDNEAVARMSSADAQVALRRRARNDEGAPTRSAARRRAEDAVFDAEKALSEARAALDRAAVDRRAERISDADLDAARAALTRAQDRVRQQRAELRRVETDAPLPTQVEGQLTIARADWLLADAALEKLTIRAPIGGTVLQMNARAGEMAAPSATQPLVLLGDVSALRVRAELDERDIGEVKVGQSVVVRPAAFRGREMAGTVAFIAPLVEAARTSSRTSRNMTDVDVVEVLVNLAEPGQLAVGMKVDVYFRQDSAPPARQ
jgi:HlyD family secretion protein